MILTLCVTVPTLVAKTPAATLTTGENTYTVSAVPGDYILTVAKLYAHVRGMSLLY